MFQKLGRLVSRRWPFFLLAWLATLGFAFVAAPAWQDVVLDREFAFLPEYAPSRKGEELFKKAFPDQFNPSNLVLVMTRQPRLLPGDKKFVEEYLQPGLLEIQNEEGGPAHQKLGNDGNIAAPSADKGRPVMAVIHTIKDPGAGGLLISQDGQAMLVVIELTSEFLEHRNRSTVKKINDLVARLRTEGKIPQGLQIEQTGTAALGNDITAGQMRSAHATTTTTVWAVIILLLLIYRAPVVAMVPLCTVFVAVQLALKFLSALAGAGVVTLFEGVQTFITVVVYGAGVDYCLFLIARYREELANTRDSEQAVAAAVGKTGPALTASAATVTLGIGTMIFARFGEFHYAGVDIACSLFIGLCAVLTLTPTLLRLTRRSLFWPGGVSEPSPGETGRAPPDPQANRSGSLRILSMLTRIRFPWNRLAAALKRQPGMIWLATVAVMLPLAVVGALNITNLDFNFVKRLPADAPSVIGLEQLKQHFPEGFTAPVIVVIRKPGMDFQSDSGLELIATLTDDLSRQRKDLGLADIRSLAKPLGVTDAAQEAMDELAIQAQLDKKKKAGSYFDQAVAVYVSRQHTTQLQMVLDRNPLLRSSLDDFERLQEAVRGSLPQELKGAEVEFLGLTASVSDLRLITTEDQWRIEGLVLACVLAILIVLLWRPLVSIYLIVSVVLSFLTALGATFALFWMLEPQEFAGLDWKVPIFLFVILVAVGEDYNIFLLTRVHEEQKRLGPVDGIAAGLIKTGGIITSCGMIMAGTFASLLPGSLQDLLQLGFALVLGVLLDTFVVRPVLVPAFLIMLDGGRFQFLSRWIKKSKSLLIPAPAREVHASS